MSARSRLFAISLLFVFSILVVGQRVNAQTPVTWTFNGNGLWSTDASWSTGATPDGNGFDVTIDDGDSIVTVTLDTSRSVRTLTLGASDTLDIQGNASSVSFTSALGFTNAGNIVLTSTGASTSRLSITSGAITNAASGLFCFQSGDGSRRFDGDLVNNGTVQINKDTVFDKSAGSYTNNGLFSINGATTLSVGNTGTLSQNAGTLDLDGTLDVSGGTLTHNGGTLDFGTNALIQSGNYNYLGGTIVGTPKLKNTTFTLGPGTNSASFFMNDNNILASNINAGQTVTVEATDFSISLSSNSAFTNAGNLILTDSGAGTARLSVGNGAITVSPSGLLRFNVGLGARRFDGDLINNGTVQINKDTVFDKSGGSYANNASFSVSGGHTLSIGNTGTLSQNAGTLDLDGTLDVSGGTFTHNGGTLDFGTNALIQSGNYNYLGGTIIGTPKLKNTVFALGPGTNPASFFMNDNNALASNVNANQTITVEATDSSITLSSANAFTNNGNLILTNSGTGTARLSVGNGAITNAASGLLRFNFGPGARRFDGDLINNGTVQINKDTVFDKSGGSYANNASFSVSGGHTLSIGNTGTLSQNAGTLDLDGTLDVSGGTFTHNGGTLDFGANALIQSGAYNYLGGTIIGTPKLKNTVFVLGPGTNPASFFMNDNNALASNVNANQTITVEATDLSITLSSANAFTNNGNLILTNSGTGTARLSVGNGAITVGPSGLLRFNFGPGARRFDGDLINNGTVQINKDTVFDKSSGSYANNAAFSVSGGHTLSVGNTGTLSQNAGTLDLDGTLDISGGTFTHNGGTLDFGANALIQSGNYNYLGGTIIGTPKLRNLTLALGPTSGPASFLMDDNNALASNVNVNQTITVEATDFSITLSSASAFTNSGNLVLRSTGAGTTRLSVNGTLTNGATGLVHFQSGQGARRFDGDLVNNGTLRVGNDTVFDKSMGSYTNNGKIQVDSGDTLTIGNNGTLTNQSGTTLTGGTYDVAGTFRYRDAVIATNQAEIILRGPSAFILDDGGSFDAVSFLTTNGANGKFRLLNNRDFFTASPFTNHGLLELGGGQFQATTITNSSTGEIRGTGVFAGTVTSSGVVAPGSSTGTLTINSYVQNSPGTLAIELGGTANGQFDKLVLGFMTLSGTLNVSLSGNFLPKPADSFDILDWGARVGAFNTVQLPQPNHIIWNTSQLDTSGVISVDATYYAGDFNRDNQITAADIPAMLKALTNLSGYASTNSLTPAQLVLVGDFDSSGTVTNRDIQGLLNLVSGFGLGSVAPVPEPSTFLLTAVGFAFAAVWRSRRKNIAKC